MGKTNSVDILINGKETVGGASNSAINGLNRLNESLHSTQGNLRNFNTVMELALGFHIGRFFFEKVHEGLAHLGEGFAEAQKQGLGFNESLGEGIQKMFGLTTQSEKLAQAMEKSQAAAKGMLEHRQEFDKLMKGKPDEGQFPYLVPKGKAEESLKKLREDRDKARDAAMVAFDEMNNVGGSRGILNLFGYGHKVGQDIMGLTEKQKAAADEAERKAIAKRFAKPLATYRLAEQEYIDAQAEGENANATAFDRLFRGKFNPAFRDAKSALSPSRLWDLLDKPGTLLDQGTTAFGEWAGDVKHKQDVENFNQRMAYKEFIFGRTIAEMSEKREAPSGIAADSERFLTRAPGSPEMTELKKTNHLLTAQGVDIKEMVRVLMQFGPIGVAARL